MATRQANSIPVIPDNLKVILPAGRLLVIPEENDKTVAGIIVSGQKDQQIGTVIQVGPRLPWQEEYPVGCKIRFRSTNSLVFIEKDITFVSVHHEDVGVGIVYNQTEDQHDEKVNPCQAHDRDSQAEEKAVQCPDCWVISGGCSGKCKDRRP